MVDGVKTWVFYGRQDGAIHRDGETYGKKQTDDECIKQRDEFVAKFKNVDNKLVAHDCKDYNHNLVYHGKKLDPYTLHTLPLFTLMN